MPKLLLPLIAALAVGGAATAGGVYLATRDAGVEEVARPPSVLDTPEPSPTASAAAQTPTAEATVTSSATADWESYSDPGGKFTIRYPQSWFESDGSLYSRDPATFKGGYDPEPDVAEVEIGYYPDDGVSGCGVLSVDPDTGQVSPQADATPVKLGGESAWQLVREPGDPAIEGELTRIQAISLIYKGYCFNIAAYFTQEIPDVAAFEEIVGTFRFTR
jgi:hypothetical protein